MNFNDFLPDDIAIITRECVAMPDEVSEVTDIIDKAPDFNEPNDDTTHGAARGPTWLEEP